MKRDIIRKERKRINRCIWREKSDALYKKINLISRQGLFTTQTQNKTRQNYYAVFTCRCRGGIRTDDGYSHTHRQFQGDLRNRNKLLTHLFTLLVVFSDL